MTGLNFALWHRNVFFAGWYWAPPCSTWTLPACNQSYNCVRHSPKCSSYCSPILSRIYCILYMANQYIVIVLFTSILINNRPTKTSKFPYFCSAMPCPRPHVAPASSVISTIPVTRVSDMMAGGVKQPPALPHRAVCF